MPSPKRTFDSDGQPLWTWQKIREYMGAKYSGSYTAAELRQIEIKWRRIFSSVGWSVKGQ